MRNDDAARLLSRRWFLQQCGVGLGAAALADILAGSGHAAPAGDDPLAPRGPHHAPKAKRVIYLFMGGGPSHLELFDHKPKLARMDGSLPPPEFLEGYRAAFIEPNSKLLGPRYGFNRYGQSGAEICDQLPHIGSVADDVAVVRSCVTTQINHAPAQLMMSTGHQQFGRPSFGSWTTYGLGSESRDLPSFVVMNSGSKGPSAGTSNWGCGFLPTVHQGVEFRSGAEPVLYLANPPGVSGEVQRDALDAINGLNRLRLDVVGDPEIATRISSYEMAHRMQAHCPDVVDISAESPETLALYGAEPGKASFANNCLLARRLVERGVRFVELFHEAWDQHGDLRNGHARNCKDVDKATAGLITDLKRRGLLEDTLVIWGGEFGRTPMVQGGNDGRDHHPGAFTMLLAGGGVKPGVTYGATDELGFNAVENPVSVHDLHATLLHLLGFDHTRLTFRFQGRDYRLTDVHGEVVKGLLA